MPRLRHIAGTLLLITASTFQIAQAGTGRIAMQIADQVGKEINNNQTYSAPITGKAEVAFSPNGGGEQLITKAITSARQEILVLAYGFSAAPIVDALRNAIARGVVVRIVTDYKSNISEDKTGKARSALNTLSMAGAEVKIIDAYPIHHDKLMIIDRQTLQNGSYNYTASAQKNNSENVLVLWNNPELSQVYFKHFERNYRLAKPYQVRY